MIAMEAEYNVWMIWGFYRYVKSAYHSRFRCRHMYIFTTDRYVRTILFYGMNIQYIIIDLKLYLKSSVFSEYQPFQQGKCLSYPTRLRGGVTEFLNYVGSAPFEPPVTDSVPWHTPLKSPPYSICMVKGWLKNHQCFQPFSCTYPRHQLKTFVMLGTHPKLCRGKCHMYVTSVP